MEVFFYGLFMDGTILRKNGTETSNPRKGFLKDYTLKIGNRASLVPLKGEQAWGMVMTMDKEAVDRLYAEPSVADYIPEVVQVTLENGDSIPAMCYNLPAESLTGTNAHYAQSLYELARQIGFPDEYLEQIRNLGN